MRLIGSLVIVVALAFAGCSKPSSTQTEDEQSPAPATPAGSVAKKESPSAPSSSPGSKETSQPSPATATPPPELAPEGVYYVVAAARVETSAGIQVLLPGTGVKKIRPGVYLTPVGEVPLANSQVTNIISVARAARDAALAEQAALKQRMATPPAIAQRTRVEAQKPDANHQAAVRQMEVDQAKRQIAALEQQKATIQNQISVLAGKLSKEGYNQTMRGRAVTSTTGQQMNAAQSQLQAVDDQIAAAYNRLSALH